MTLTILIYIAAHVHQQQHITEAAAWWHARRADVFEVRVVDQPPTPDEHTIAVAVVPGPLQCGAWPSVLGCSEWHRITLVGSAGPWVAAHEMGHAIYLLPDVWDGMDIMNPFAARDAYERGAIGCASLAALGTPCQRVYLPMVANASNNRVSGAQRP